MKRNKMDVFIHYVWATWDRLPLITPMVEKRLHRNIHSEAEKHGCTVLAINGMPDHVHLLVKMPSTISVADLIQQIKGVSSHFANEQLFTDLSKFKWQGFYAAFSVSRWDVERIANYIKRQKEHHYANETIEDYEQIVEFAEQSD